MRKRKGDTDAGIESITPDLITGRTTGFIGFRLGPIACDHASECGGVPSVAIERGKLIFLIALR
jgi:hypothetical protein